MNGTTTWFLWNGDELLAEYKSTGQLQRRFATLNGRQVAYFAEISNQFFAVHTDHLGAPRMLTNSAGKKLWEVQYESFGKAAVKEDPDGDGTLVKYPIRFPGQYYDAESGLHYNYFRDYDPGIGRYITSDPIGLAGGFNTYAYVGGNPIIKIDPLGLAGVISGSGASGTLGAGLGGLLGGGNSSSSGSSTSLFCTHCVVPNSSQSSSGEKPSWWPDGIPHPSDPPQETSSECPVDPPKGFDDQDPFPDKCAKISQVVLNACLAAGGSSKGCATKAFLAFLAFLACKILTAGGG